MHALTQDVSRIPFAHDVISSHLIDQLMNVESLQLTVTCKNAESLSSWEVEQGFNKMFKIYYCRKQYSPGFHTLKEI